MPAVPPPSLPTVLRLLGQRPSLPQSLNLLAVLLAPFLSGSSTPDPSWSSIQTFYGPHTTVLLFSTKPESIEDGWAIFLLRELPSAVLKIHLAFSDPSPSSSSRQGLFDEFLRVMKEVHPGRNVAFGGLPDGLVGTFENAVGEMVGGGGGRSFKVQKRIEDIRVQPGKELPEKFSMGVVEEHEVAALLDEGIGAYPPSEFIPLLHLSSCIRDTSDPSNKIVSWCFLYEDLSVAALYTSTTHRSLSLASHTIRNLASNLSSAFARLPVELRDPVGSGWVAADWNEGNPSGQKFFEREGWELLEEGVRWTKGRI